MTALQSEITFLTDVAAYYLLGHRLDIDLAEVFDTKQRDFSLEIQNIRPEMIVTTSATVERIAIENPERKKWKRQDTWITNSSGSVKLTLWNGDIREKINIGDEIKLVNCWAKRYRGDIQISLGKNGAVQIQ